jgi:hypothetical protein
VLKLVAVAAAVTTIAVGAMPVTVSGRPGGAQCLHVRASVLRTLRDGLLPAVRPQLRSARAVKARGTFTVPGPKGTYRRRNPWSGGVYFISANLGTRGIATWATDLLFFRGDPGQIAAGRILLFPMSKTARAVVDHNSGWAALPFPLSVLAESGIKTTTYGYAQSRACVK